ncbi:MAG TPA: hypothetical protein VFK47_00855 [Ktedonobacteraceae bacterium]|nr:hypothetical protein [Ktedonobacteraceae bacterium]
MQKPSVGRVVHYVSYGTPGGEFSSVCRAAVVASVQNDTAVDLVVLNPTGLFFNASEYSEVPKGGTWHWPEMV